MTQAAYVALIVPVAHRGRVEETLHGSLLSEARPRGQDLLGVAVVRALTRGVAVHDVEPLRMPKHAPVALTFRY